MILHEKFHDSHAFGLGVLSDIQWGGKLFTQRNSFILTSRNNIKILVPEIRNCLWKKFDSS